MEDNKVQIKSLLHRRAFSLIDDRYIVHRDRELLAEAPIVMMPSALRFQTKLVNGANGITLYESKSPVLWSTLFYHERYGVPVLQVELASMMAIEQPGRDILVHTADFRIYNKLCLPESISPIKIDWFVKNSVAFTVMGPDHDDPTPMSEAQVLSIVARGLNIGPDTYGVNIFPPMRQLRKLPKRKSMTFRGNLITKLAHR